MTMIDCGVRIHGFHVEDVAVVVLSGEIDMAAAPMLREAFDALGPEEHVYVDCSAVGFIDAEGLAALCEVAQRNVVAGCPLHVHPSDALRYSIETGGVAHLFTLD